MPRDAAPGLYMSSLDVTDGDGRKVVAELGLKPATSPAGTSSPSPTPASRPHTIKHFHTR